MQRKPNHHPKNDPRIIFIPVSIIIQDIVLCCGKQEARTGKLVKKKTRNA